MNRRYIDLDFDRLANDVLTEVGELLAEEGKSKMDSVSKGRYEYSYKVKKWRWVSRVGDAPNNETGDLNSTIRYKINGRTMEYGSGISGTHISYAKFLEDRGKLNRPNVIDSVQRGRHKIRRKIESKFMSYLRWNGD